MDCAWNAVAGAQSVEAKNASNVRYGGIIHAKDHVAVNVEKEDSIIVIADQRSVANLVAQDVRSVQDQCADSVANVASTTVTN
jgi:hypothetical protein